jgi:glutamyl-tRNA reductase
MIGIIGLNHKTAPVAIRESASFAEEDAAAFIRQLCRSTVVEEAVVLSTCNRTEIYFQAPAADHVTLSRDVIKAVRTYKKIEDEIADYFYMYHDLHAVEHLFSVAAGLNSLVLGENQVLGQVKEAYRISATRGCTGTVLNRLFHKSFEAGKRVRAETAMNEGASSVSSAAVELAARSFGTIEGCSVLLIGAGETGELVLQSLADRGSTSICVTNRTHERACMLAEKYQTTFCDYDAFREQLPLCDIVVVSTGAKDPIIKKDEIEEIVEKRNGKTLFLIDLSVPRNVEEGVGKLENVIVYNIDDLEEVVADNYGNRRSEIEKARAVIEEIRDEFMNWVTTLNLSPTIEQLKGKFESLYTKELEALQRKASPREYERVEEFAHYIKGKCLGLVIKNLRSLSDNGKNVEYIELVKNLFDLKEQ